MGMEWYTLGTTMFGSLLLLMLIGIPVGFTLLVTSLATLALLGKGTQILFDLPGYFFHHLNSFTLTCVPLFILMALYAQRARFSDDLFRSMGIWLRRVPGSLNTVGIATCAIFSAISGTSVATAAAVGLVAMPSLKKYGYEKKLAVGALAAGGALGILIPPSVPMIMYCIITEQSVGHMFAGGIFPGIMTAGIFILYIMIRCRINPKLAPPIPAEALGGITPRRATLNILPLTAVILSVLLTIYFGIATPTEAAAVGTMAAIILGIAYRRLNLREIVKASFEGVRLGAFIILIFLGALAFGHATVRGGVASGLTEFVVSLGISRYAVLVMILGALFILGFFMDPTPIILTTMPVLYPLAMKFGFDPIYFGVVCTMILETAAITPPVGFNLFVMKGIGQGYVTLTEIIIGAAPFVLLYILAIGIVILVPDIILYLPKSMMK
jgi:C4-dicarboxylate transporter DctM subunit